KTMIRSPKAKRASSIIMKILESTIGHIWAQSGKRPNSCHETSGMATTSLNPLVSRSLGDFELTILSDGPYFLDAGSMFGVVPKSLWSRKAQPNDRNLTV